VSLRRASSRAHAWLYRRSGGRLLRKMGGQPVLLLTTTGRRSGHPRTTPLQYSEPGGRLVLVAANGGSKREPHWYHNLIATPKAVVQRGSERLAVRAHEVGGRERDLLWSSLTAANRQLAGAEARSGRRFPVMVLEP
jgi:F420H(2)-dependent quinone reductase